MNNYEKIKAMSIEEMTIFLLDKDCCNFCTYGIGNTICIDDGCRNGIKQWLESEVEE